MKQIVILTLGLFFLSCSHLPSERAISSLNQSEIDDLWVMAGKKKSSKMVRSNVTHYWAWMEAHARPLLGAALSAEGELTGDPHYFNFRDIHDASGLNGYALVDVDDSGSGPLLLEFVRYSLFVKYYFKELNSTENFNQFQLDLYTSYLQGLAQVKRNRPFVLRNAIDQSRSELEKQNALWVAKKLDDFPHQDFGLRKTSLGLVSLSEVPAFQDAGTRLKNILLKQNRVIQIYDIGYASNDSGSSRGLNRFWFSTLIKNNVHQILECKQLVRPATDYYKKQVPTEIRIENVLKFYSDFTTVDSYVMNENSNSYWCRPREFEFLKRPDIENLSFSDLKELSLYLANWIGTKQGLQPAAAGLRNELSKDPSYLSRVTQLMAQYEADMERHMAAGH